MNSVSEKNGNTAISQESKVSSFVRIPDLGTIASALAIIFLIYAFFTGILNQFYASFLFFLYSFTNRMWISVIMLGLFQTILMIPFRIIRVVKSNNIQEFQHNVEKIKSETQQAFILKKRFRQGNTTFLFYAVDFVMQLVSFISLGRLFLTDFYSKPLNPEHLYKWVKYPDYPLLDTWFKIPYPAVTKTIDFGWKVLLPTWIVLIVLQLLIIIFKRANENKKAEEELKAKIDEEAKKTEENTESLPTPTVTIENIEPNILSRYATGYLLLFMLIAWFLVKHFPIGWKLGIFSGDVSVQNTTFNTLTAIATFITMMWHSVPRIIRKGNLAEKMGIDIKIIDKTQKEMFKDSLFTATLVGLGAFFITNQIPSAFELSIFTLEVISLLSPFTLDKAILGSLALQKDKITEAEVAKEFNRHE